MAKDVIVSGDELELLAALDRTGCVLTDDGKFYCDLENGKLRYNSRLPVRIRGTYAPEDKGWKVHYAVMPAPRTLAIGAFCLIALISFLVSGAGFTGAAFFSIFCGAMVINFLSQKNACLRKFENALLNQTDHEL